LGLALCHDSLAGTQGAWFSELFDARVRTSGAPAARRGGTTPFWSQAVRPGRTARAQIVAVSITKR
ncbi:hypothetical protein AB0O07_13770, partial [Streptomyces sp. NPDC093085]